jgi:hypothetical protein
MLFKGIFRRILDAARGVRKDETARFFLKNYEARVAEIQSLHNANLKKSILRSDFFFKSESAANQDIRSAPRFADDILVGLVHTLRPDSVMQLGCWSLAELETLKVEGYTGKLIATDFHKDYVLYLEQGYKEANNSDYSFQVLDIECAQGDDLNGVELISAIQVLSNIQPEGMMHFAQALRNASSVKCILIGDNYSWESIDPRSSTMSLPQIGVRNWCHNYPFFAHMAGFKCSFLPDMVLKTNDRSRGIFVLSRDIDHDVVDSAISLGASRFLQRQASIWLAR